MTPRPAIADVRTEPDGTSWRDLNGNGVLDPYEDPRRPVSERVDDLVRRLSVDEKIGLMYQAVASVSPTGHLRDDAAQPTRPVAAALVGERYITHLNLQAIPDPVATATWMNEVQELAARGPHGIPVTFSTDPRHSFIENMGASFRADHVSVWPEPIGLAALRSPAVVREFADIARREYLALGLRSSLHPTLDLATEPRWARQYSTFGSDAHLVAEIAEAYLDGFQGDRVGPDSVACMAKHFPGGGPQRDGEDPHFPYGREQVYPAGMFEYHLLPFRRAVERGVSAIMPYYGMPVGLEYRGERIEEVGFGYNRQVITGILRDELGFDGVVCTDWGLISDSQLDGRWLPARAWGAEHLTREQRAAKILAAGCDQFGGENDTSVLRRALDLGLVEESRLDISVRRLLRVKFELGLFDDPFVEVAGIGDRLRQLEDLTAGHRAQASSITVLIESDSARLPIPPQTRVFAPDIDREVVEHAGLAPADSAAEADLVVLRMATPYERRDTFMLESGFRAGSLAFGPEELRAVEEQVAGRPAIVDVALDRPAILTPLADGGVTLVASYGASAAAVLDALTGAIPPIGRLPFDVPSRAEEVEASAPDAPGDMPSALFRAGHGRGA